MPNIYLELGKNIRKYRKKKELSTPELAKRLNISTGLVNNIENGRHDVFKLELLLNLMKELDVSLGELLQFDGIDIRSINLQQQLKKILSNEVSTSNAKVDYLNHNLNQILTLYLATLSKFDYDDSAIDYITKHIVEQLNFIKNIDSIKGKVPS